MHFSIPYGKSEARFSVDETALLFDGRMEEIPQLADFEASLRESLARPIGCPPLAELARDKRNIVVLIEDNTRYTPLPLLLPILVNHLNESGVPDGAIRFLTAPGTHRVMTGDEIFEKVGGEIFRRFEILQHDANDQGSLADLGSVDVGGYDIPVHVNRIALEADLLIGIGEIVPHSDAGYSGGAKIVQPGICGFATTAATHAAAGLLDEIPLGVMDNPCRLGMEVVGRQVGLDFIVNVVKNAAGQIAGVFSGDFVEAHRAGSKLAERSYRVEIPAPADIVVVSSSPCDLDYWQAEKGLVAAYFAVRPGGIIVFAAPCYEGMAHNHPRFLEWLAMPLHEILTKMRVTSPDDLEADLVSADIAAGNARARERASVFSVTEGLSGDDLEILQYTPYPSVQAALDAALARMPKARVGILPKGGTSLPVLLSRE